MSQVRRIAQLTEPAEEPVTLAELKTQLRITNSADDAYLTSIIKVARLGAEDYTGRVFVQRTFRQYIDSNPGNDGGWWDGVRQASIEVLAPRELELLKPPLLSVQAMTAYDDADQATVVDPGVYYVDAVSQDHPGRIVLRRGQTWPVVLRVANALTVDFTAGYGNAAAVPGDVKQAIMMLAGYFYANRGDCACASGGAAACVVPCGASLLLDSFKVMRF